MREIEVHMEDRSIVVNGIPDDAKITYGGVRPDQPGSKTNTIRIYRGQGQNNQLAVFRGVLWWRDTSLTIREIESEKRDWIDR